MIIGSGSGKLSRTTRHAAYTRIGASTTSPPSFRYAGANFNIASSTHANIASGSRRKAISPDGHMECVAHWTHRNDNNHPLTGGWPGGSKGRHPPSGAQCQLKL